MFVSGVPTGWGTGLLGMAASGPGPPNSPASAPNLMALPFCRNQAVRIQEGRYRHPGCYTCADCGLNLKMRGHFWVGDELYCEKHARQRYSMPGALSSRA